MTFYTVVTHNAVQFVSITVPWSVFKKLWLWVLAKAVPVVRARTQCLTTKYSRIHPHHYRNPAGSAEQIDQLVRNSSFHVLDDC